MRDSIYRDVSEPKADEREWIVGGKEAGDYQTGINKCIFELAVASQELMAEEWDVLDLVEKGYVDWEVWRYVGEVYRF